MVFEYLVKKVAKYMKAGNYIGWVPGWVGRTMAVPCTTFYNQ